MVRMYGTPYLLGPYILVHGVGSGARVGTGVLHGKGRKVIVIHLTVEQLKKPGALPCIKAIPVIFTMTEKMEGAFILYLYWRPTHSG